MPRLPIPRRRNRTRGQGLVEFALVLPVLILFLLITLDFGRLFMSYVTLNNVARVAANYGSTNPGGFGAGTNASYVALVDHESAGLNCALQADANGNTPPTPTFPTGTGLSGMSVAIMTCDFSLLTPFVTAFFGGPLEMTSKAEFPIRTGAIANIGGSTTLPPPGSPVASFTFTGVTGGTIGGSGNVTGTGTVTVNVADASSNVDTWEWSWGDGSPDEFVPAPNAHVYSSPGTYSVRLTVTNTVGTSVLTRLVIVTSTPTPIPVAGFYGTPTGSGYITGGGASGTPITGTYPLVVDFTNQSTDGIAYSWDFGDGSSPSTLTNPQHQYSALGFFTVTLTVTDPTGGTPSIRTNYITTGCQVPNFANTSTATAASTWSGAHFSGTMTYQPDNAPGNSQTSNTPPVPAKIITSQTLAGGNFVTPTRQNASSPWVCAGNIKVKYAP